MKTKKYLNCLVTTNEGTTYQNELKLSEVKLINTMVQQNRSVLVNVVETHEADYKSIFG